MYPLVSISVALGLLAVTQTVAQERVAPVILPPLVEPAEQELEAAAADEEAPPPIAAPVTKVTVMAPHMLELQDKLRAHPGQRSAEQRVCEAHWQILLGQSNYYPRLNASLSGGSKWIDHTTRAVSRVCARAQHDD